VPVGMSGFCEERLEAHGVHPGDELVRQPSEDDEAREDEGAGDDEEHRGGVDVSRKASSSGRQPSVRVAKPMTMVAKALIAAPSVGENQPR
jgi:hypothetical protein